MKTILSIFATLIAISANAQNAKMRLRGECKESEGKMLYLSQGYVDIDSAKIHNGKFEFKLSNIEPDEYVIKRVTPDGKMEFIIVYLDYYDTQINMENETYSLFNTNFIKNTSVGNPTHNLVTELNEIFMRGKGDPLQNKQFTDRLQIVAERGDMATAYLMWKYGQTFQALFPVDKLRSYVDQLKPEVRKTIVGKRFLETYETYFKSAVGGKAPNFSMETPDGKSLSLYEFLKGKKWVLVDFWASWCAPCRAKNPQIVKLYNDLHSTGLDILGVSLDTDAVKWKKAIDDDKLPWTHISDLKGWKSSICKDYGFNGIPHMVLLNSEGNILASGNDIINQLEYYVRGKSKNN